MLTPAFNKPSNLFLNTKKINLGTQKRKFSVSRHLKVDWDIMSISNLIEMTTEVYLSKEMYIAETFDKGTEFYKDAIKNVIDLTKYFENSLEDSQALDEYTSDQYNNRIDAEDAGDKALELTDDLDKLAPRELRSKLVNREEIAGPSKNAFIEAKKTFHEAFSKMKIAKENSNVDLTASQEMELNRHLKPFNSATFFKR